MKYLIDEKVLFDCDNKQLSSTTSPNVIVPLTTTASRLLEEMLQHPHSVLPRALLLKKVWEDNGYAPSDANLNNNISVLRKYFSSLSDTEIDLRTVPKIGFQLNATVILQEGPTGDCKQTEIIEDKVPQAAIHYNTGEHRGRRSWIVPAAVGILLFLPILFLFIRQERGGLVSQKNGQRVAKFEQCEVFNLSSDSVSFDTVLKSFPAIRTRCSNKQVSIYYDFSSMNKDRSRDLFVSLCFKSDKSGYLKCENLKSYPQL